MTTKHYLASDRTECETVVVEVGNDEVGNWVRLAETVFHPQGGGQKSDRGSIQGAVVSKVVQRDGEVFHYLDQTAPFTAGQRVHARIDPDWRQLQSRWHSAGHLLAALLESSFPGLKAVAGHHWPGEARIEATGASFPDPAIVQAGLDLAVKEAITQNLPVKIAGDPLNSRAIQIGDYPPVPCGGTHPTGTAEIGVVRVRGVKIKGGRMRLSYEVQDVS